MFQESNRGHVMSLSQLSDLWHFDMLMANLTLGLPLRKCSAVPKDDPQFPAMDSNSFRILKRNVANMWVSASYLFTSGRTDSLGWGLFVSDDYQKNE